MNSIPAFVRPNSYSRKNKELEITSFDSIEVLPFISSSQPVEREWMEMRNSILNELESPNEGSLSDILTDIRFAQKAGKLMWSSIKAFQPEVIVGLGLQAMSLLYATAIAADTDGHSVRVLMIREKRKQHNQKKWVEGKAVSAGASAVFINDFFADENTLTVAEQALSADEHALKFKAVALFFDATSLGELEYGSLQGAPLASLFDASAFPTFEKALKMQVPGLAAERQVFPPRRDPIATRRLRNSVKTFAEENKAVTSVTTISRTTAPAASEFRRIVEQGLPAIVTGLIGHWPLSKLTPATLKELHGDLRVCTVEGYMEKPFSKDRIRTETSLADYLSLIEESSSPFPPYVGNQKLPALSALCEWPDIYQENQEVRIWLGPKNTVTPLHCDFEDNFFAQIWGHKQFILYPPDDDEFLYTWQANPVLFASRFDPENPDYRRWPLAKKASRISYVLKPGELLFLPAGWFHHVRSLELSLSVNRWAKELPMAVKK